MKNLKPSVVILSIFFAAILLGAPLAWRMYRMEAKAVAGEPAKTETKAPAPAKVSDEQRLNDLSLQKLFIEKEYRIKELEAEQLKQSYTKMMLEYEPLKTKADAAAKVKADAAKKK